MCAKGCGGAVSVLTLMPANLPPAAGQLLVELSPQVPSEFCLCPLWKVGVAHGGGEASAPLVAATARGRLVLH